MSVRRIDDDHINARADQRLDAFLGIAAGAHRGADTQRTTGVLAREREILGLLEILGRDHAPQSVVVADNQHFLDAVLVQQAQHLLVVRTLANRHELVLRRHDLRDRRIQACLEAQVTVRHDADSFIAIDDRHAGNAHGSRQLDDFADGHV